MNAIAAVGYWSGWYWREQRDSIALLYRAVQAKRQGDMIGNRRWREAARAAEARLVALVEALRAFCRARDIDPGQALAASGVDRFKPAFDVAPDLTYQATIENTLAELAGRRAA